MRLSTGDKTQSADIEPDVRLRRKYRTIWYGIWNRCYNHGFKSFKDYGLRGITLSEELKDFRFFLTHLKALPGYGVQGLELDRCNNLVGYEAGNLRFVTRQQNCKNRRSNIQVTYKGETMCLSDFCGRYAAGVPKTTIYRWYKDYKLPPEELIARAALMAAGSVVSGRLLSCTGGIP